MHEALRVLVIQFKLVSLEYFLDQMTEYELYIMYDNLEYSDFNTKEMSRILGYIIAQTQSRKKLKPDEIMQFPWDEGYKKGKAEHKVDTKEDIERAKRFRDKFEKILIDEQKKEVQK